MFVSGELKRDSVARWYVAGGLSRITRESIQAQTQAAMNAWSSVANVEGVQASSEDQADLVIRVASIDGRQGVLADCMLPGPRVQIMRLDNDELWTVFMGPDVPNQSIDLYRVLLHELGHFWGMGHAPQGSPNLMAPVYSRNIWEPRSWEIGEMQRGYGPPKASPTPTPSSNLVTIKVWDAGRIEIPGYRVQKI